MKFDKEIDDVFTILFNQKSSEFVIIHNNKTDCKCLFCSKLIQGLKELV